MRIEVSAAQHPEVAVEEAEAVRAEGEVHQVQRRPKPRQVINKPIRHRVQHAHGRAPDVRARAVTFDERDDRLVGDVQGPVRFHGDGLSTRGDLWLGARHGPGVYHDCGAP